MLCADEGDDVVDPMHSYKIAATLQHELPKAAGHTNPVLLRVSNQGGHAVNPPEFAEMFAFAADFCGARWEL
jgi:prolyl oligopeptidase PreP (S9A serine peptidase family)